MCLRAANVHKFLDALEIQIVNAGKFERKIAFLRALET